MKMEKSECSETSAHKIQTPGNHPKERIQHYTFDYNTVSCRQFEHNLTYFKEEFVYYGW